MSLSADYSEVQLFLVSFIADFIWEMTETHWIIEEFEEMMRHLASSFRAGKDGEEVEDGCWHTLISKIRLDWAK